MKLGSTQAWVCLTLKVVLTPCVMSVETLPGYPSHPGRPLFFIFTLRDEPLRSQDTEALGVLYYHSTAQPAQTDIPALDFSS